ncbi:Phosphate regulon sensor protein PhoR (SphS) [hydrothermal vent metagenome]|uniref:histidine kinase n=1 Tax=hydrothermal vent metagenome TaxID=652676 RepID=A0A1W1CPZ9_9ZZZZ
MQFKSLKTRVLLWFGMVSFLVLTLFVFSFNYFLNNSINNNLKNRLQFIAHKYNDHIEEKNIGVAIIKSGKIVRKNSAFTLKKYKKYLKQKKNFFIIHYKNNDDYIDALYLEKQANKTIMIVKKNIDNKIEDFQDTFLWLIPILLFVFIFLASKMIDKIVLPINKLREATKDITVTQFTQEIELPKEDDEIRDLVLSFNAMIKRIKDGVEQLDRFNSDVSHELKTPLTVIQGEVEIALRKSRKPQEYEKALKIIQKQSLQITSIVNQLLLLTKYSKENIQESFQNCAVDSMLLATIDRFQTQLSEKNLKLNIKKIEPINFKANPVLMESIFTNLIENAIKYTPKDKAITLSLFQNTKIHFTIEDEGVGIEKEHLQKITERFYRADSARNKKIEGFGLGLSIVQNSVFMHNGTLQIKSKKGSGTVVDVVF